MKTLFHNIFWTTFFVAITAQSQCNLPSNITEKLANFAENYADTYEFMISSVVDYVS